MDNRIFAFSFLLLSNTLKALFADKAFLFSPMNIARWSQLFDTIR